MRSDEWKAVEHDGGIVFVFFFVESRSGAVVRVRVREGGDVCYVGLLPKRHAMVATRDNEFRRH